MGTSLMVQWLGICLPLWGSQVEPRLNTTRERLHTATKTQPSQKKKKNLIVKTENKNNTKNISVGLCKPHGHGPLRSLIDTSAPSVTLHGA